MAYEVRDHVSGSVSDHSDEFASCIVVLDCHPVFTTLVILSGWVVKTGVADVLSGFVGQGGAISDAWLAYSIP